VGHAASRLSRVLRRGGGRAIGGKVALALAPGLLHELGAGRTVGLVTGTNGKTTTTRLLANALATSSTVTTSRGGNLPQAMIDPLTRDADAAVLEVDELWLPHVARELEPRVVVLLNLSRDQLDRMNEVRRVAATWRTFVASAAPECTIVANADDPAVVWAVGNHERVVWVGAGVGWAEDGSLCPSCGRLWDGVSACACGFALPVARWWMDVRTAADRLTGTRVPLPLALPGACNRADALIALAAAVELGVDAASAARAMAGVRSIEHRYETVCLGDHEVRLLMGKNPASWLELLPILEDSDDPIVMCLNADPADGTDTSWIWDVPFERLSRRRLVAAAGRRRADLAVRLHVAGLEPLVADDPLAAVAALPPGRVELVATYTAFHQLVARLRPAA
jgi:UDP-N-acetylmuramyl tripeptide synthase